MFDHLPWNLWFIIYHSVYTHQIAYASHFESFFYRFFAKTLIQKHTVIVYRKTTLYNAWFKKMSWQGQQDLNPRHPVLETGALPTELCP